MIYITAIHVAGGQRHEHIAEVQWLNPATNEARRTTRAGMVTWIRNGGDARVSDGQRVVGVGVIEAISPYIRTHTDGVWTDNLLALPRY